MTDQLPPGWAKAPLGTLGNWFGGGTPSKSVKEYWENGTVHWVSPKDMKRPFIDSTQDQISERAAQESATNLVPANSILMVTRSGILEHSFPVAVNTIPVTMNQDLKAVAVRGVDPTYARYFLQSRAQNILRTCKKDGTTVSSIDTDRLAAYDVSIAPAAEQKRIVSKIDELFSRIDDGERALERASILVERYRQSVLKAAVTGELTREWREKNKDTLESGEVLLARILKDRREAWEEAELEKMTTKGVMPTNDRWKHKYKDPSQPDIAGLPELPRGWAWASFEQAFVVASDEGKKLKEKDYLPSGDFAVVDQGAKFTSGWTNHRELLFSGDLPVFGFGDHTRRFKLIDIPFVVGADGLKLFHASNGYLIRFALIALQASKFEDRGYSRHFQFLKKVSFPIPPAAEQAVIVETFDRLCSQIEALVPQLKSELHRSGASRQSILRAAFSGELVPQDATDEPANVLLERIAAESVADTTTIKRGRKKKDPA